MVSGKVQSVCVCVCVTRSECGQQ